MQIAFSAHAFDQSQETYEGILKTKILKIAETFSKLGIFGCEPESAEKAYERFDILRSPVRNCRARCRFAVGKVDGMLHYLLYESGAATLIADDFPEACEGIYRIMMPCLNAISEIFTLSDGLKAIHFLGTLHGNPEEIVVTLIYETPLPSEWQEQGQWLRSKLMGAQVIGRSKGKSIVLERDFVEEVLPLPDARFLSLRHIEGSFSNPNPTVNAAALGWLCERADEIAAFKASAAAGESQEHNLLEMYCGGGNHTCGLSARFKRVVAVERDSRLCAAAEHNLAANGITNARVFACPSERFCSAVLRQRRVKMNDLRHIPGDQGHTSSELWQGDWIDFDCVLVDPPRAGLDDSVRRMVGNFDHILYVSCCPDNLVRDMESWKSTHFVVKAAAIDHFPHTKHIECAVYLRRI